MPTLTLNAWKGSDFVYEGQQMDLTQTGWIDDINIASTSDAEALPNVLGVTGMPTMGQGLSAAYPNIRLVRIGVRPSATRFRRVMLELLWQTPRGFTPTSYLIRDDSYVEQVQTNMLPILNGNIDLTNLLLLDYDGGGNASNAIKADAAVMNVTIGVRAVSIIVVRYGQPDTSGSGGGNYINFVNDSPWPTTGSQKPMGFWKLARYATDWNKYGGTYSITATAITRNICDWSSYAILRDKRTGKYVDLTNSNLSSIQGDYQFGWRKANGIGRLGYFPLSNFSDLFGF